VTEYRRVNGDSRDTAVAFLYGVATFAGATAVGHVWSPTVATANLTATVVDGTDREGNPCGVVTVNLGTGGGWLSTAAAGTWFLEYQVTFPDAAVLTWPARNPDTVVVRAQGG
jgi:hypothetical protein